VARGRSVGRAVVATGTALSLTGTVHALVNLRRVLVPDMAAVAGRAVDERVSVLLPVRDEADRVGACLEALLRSRGVPHLELLVLDDGSTDQTRQVVLGAAAADQRVHLLPGTDPPPGWLGKTWACTQLAAAATGSVLVFLDADVLVARDGIAATVQLLRDGGLDLVSPYPRQEAGSPAERLVQPLLQWSWLTTVPLGVARRSSRPTLAVANGQLLAVDAGCYRRSGGHSGADVRGAVLDDIALLRAVLRAGGAGTVADGTQVATCRMYHGWGALRDGYAKSLWTAFGSPAGGLAVAGAAAVAGVVPAVAALCGSRVGLLGYAAAVVGRGVVARRVGGRVWPDSFAHPVSVAVFGWLVVDSVRQHRAGTLAWKGRPVR
jgi:Glycosyl transferase family 2